MIERIEPDEMYVLCVPGRKLNMLDMFKANAVIKVAEGGDRVSVIKNRYGKKIKDAFGVNVAGLDIMVESKQIEGQL